MSRPVIVFTHGAWHSPEYFDQVITLLEPLGYKCVRVSLPSVGRLPATTSLDEDITVIRDAVLAELDGGNDVVLHAHSWGGLPTCSALDGLSKAEREIEGKHGVVKLTFVASFVVPEGVGLLETLGGSAEDWWLINDDGTALQPKPGPVFYHDLDSSTADYWISKLRPQSLASFLTKSKSAAWRKIPTSYLICENDNSIPLQGQEGMVATMQQAGADINSERIATGHSAHLVKPDAVSNFIRRAIDEKL